LSRIIRTISLDKLSDELAGNKSNFSKWVRDALKADNNERTHTHATLSIFRARGLCNPSASPRCGLCFPHARPPVSAIREYNEGINQRDDESQEVAIRAVQRAAFEFHESLGESAGAEIVRNDKKEPLPPHLRERKYLRRAVKWVINFI
tara:strand:+ start:851 stop:1297 length:447 start_codon:yes stop_codon:yes gene_type:complete